MEGIDKEIAPERQKQRDRVKDWEPEAERQTQSHMTRPKQ